MGYFITFEGGEGSGKSTQAAKLAEHLKSTGATVVMTREPGGTPDAEKIRELLVTGDPGRWSAEAEALLNYAARDSHVRAVIEPALKRGDWVLCDRFMDSTRVYQSYAGGCPEHLIDELENVIVKKVRPHLTLIFDIDPSIGLERARGRSGGEDRFERKGLQFHEELRDGFLAVAEREPARCRVIDASPAEEEVFAAVLESVRELANV